MGIKSKAFGDLFEDIFARSCRDKGIIATKIPDSCRRVGKGRLIAIESPFDWILTYNHRSAFIDTKTIDSDVFPCSRLVEHQVNELFAHESQGAVAGYVIWLRTTNRVFFIPAYALVNALGVRGSFSDSHPFAIYLGTNLFDIRKIFRNEPKS